jgi:transcription antitermination factor NusA-like protein
MVSKAVGERGRNIRSLSEILNKKIKVIALPRGNQDAEEFIQSIVSPVVFKGVEVKENEIILAASTQSKAALIGRNKKRLQEMQKIVSDYFSKEFRIV